MSEFEKEIEKKILKDVLHDVEKCYGAYSCLQDQIYTINNLLEEIRGLQESCLSAFDDLDTDIKSLLKLMKGVMND